MAGPADSRAARAREVAARHRQRTGGVLQALLEIVAEQGYVDRDQERAVADVFNITRAEVRGIVSFYHDLKTEPQPPLAVRVCQAEACQAVGCAALTERLEAHLGIRLGEASETAALDPVYCLGLCAQGPSMTVNDRLVARADRCDLAAELEQ